MDPVNLVYPNRRPNTDLARHFPRMCRLELGHMIDEDAAASKARSRPCCVCNLLFKIILHLPCVHQLTAARLDSPPLHAGVLKIEMLISHVD
ncbi:hypothetical protein AURDEDRAFT_163714 [Auricularia subglabra TFB-10046 SS5]|nr:hypothetical protein AURDEDRAFT_163714 [Auricularia subglabra TFB-10046 SS5]